jgi:hypothetical protein
MQDREMPKDRWFGGYSSEEERHALAREVARKTLVHLEGIAHPREEQIEDLAKQFLGIYPTNGS